MLLLNTILLSNEYLFICIIVVNNLNYLLNIWLMPPYFIKAISHKSYSHCFTYNPPLFVC